MLCRFPLFHPPFCYSQMQGVRSLRDHLRTHIFPLYITVILATETYGVTPLQPVAGHHSRDGSSINVGWARLKPPCG